MITCPYTLPTAANPRFRRAWETRCTDCGRVWQHLLRTPLADLAGRLRAGHTCRKGEL